MKKKQNFQKTKTPSSSTGYDPSYDYFQSRPKYTYPKRLPSATSNTRKPDTQQCNYYNYYQHQHQPLPRINTAHKQPTSFNEEQFNEDFSLIQNMWDDLGVQHAFRAVFESHARSLDDESRKDLFQYENASLKRLRDSLLKLSKQITNRENAILTLRKYNDVLSKTFPDPNENLDESFISNIINTIKSIRVYSVNVVNYITKIREIISYGESHGKFNVDNINKAYQYDKHYLIRMKYDVDFMRFSPICNYIETKNVQCDTFLLNMSINENSADPKKRTVPVDEELLKLIKQCQNVIKMDEFYIQVDERENTMMMKGNDGRIRNVSGCNGNAGMMMNNMSQTLHKLKETKGYTKLFLNKSSERDVMGSKVGVVRMNKSKAEENRYKAGNEGKIRIEREEIQSMTKEELMRKIDEMENEIGEEEKGENQGKEEEKEKKVKKKGKKKKKNKKEIEEKFNEKEKENNEDKEIKENEEDKNNERKVSVDNKEENEQQEHMLSKKSRSKSSKKSSSSRSKSSKKSSSSRKSSKKEESIKNEEEKVEESFHKEESIKSNIKSEKQSRKSSKSSKKEEVEESFHKEESIKSSIVKSDKSSRKSSKKSSRKSSKKEESIKNEEEKVEESIKSKKSSRKSSKSSHKENEIKSISINDPSENKTSSKHSNTSSNKNEIDEFDDKSLENEISSTVYTVSAYTSDFPSFYELYSSTYFPNIPSSQKKTFDLQNTSSPFLKGTNPKILYTYPSTTTPSPSFTDSNFIPSGICAFSFTQAFPNRLRLQLNHLSTSLTADAFSQFISFMRYIKARYTFDEMFITLHYENTSDGFVLDKDISKFFRNTLHFRWANVENLSEGKRSKSMIWQREWDANANSNYASQILPTPSFQLNELTLLRVSKKENEIDDDNVVFDKYINAFTSKALLYMLNNEGNAVISDETLNEDALKWERTKIEKNALSKLKITLNIPNVNSIEQQHDYNMKDFIAECQNVSDEDEHMINSLSLQLCPQVKNLLSIQYNNYYYNRIEDVVYTLIEPKSQGKVYKVNFNDNLNSMFIIPLTSKVKNVLLETNSNFHMKLNDFLMNAKQTQDMNDEDEHTALYIPCFRIEGHFNAENVPGLYDVKLKNQNDENVYVQSVDDYFKVEFNYDRDFNQNFNLVPKENMSHVNEVVIEDSFVVAISNQKIVTDIGVPIIQVFIVDKSTWKSTDDYNSNSNFN